MPSKNRVKTYISGGYYHIYNRGVAKMPIFIDEKDYSVFLDYLKKYLLQKEIEELLKIIESCNTPRVERESAEKLLMLNNYSERIDLLVYCLMPNHFHLLVKQNDERAIAEFMRSFMTRYSSYFNARHGRVGSLFQDIYKAVLIESDAQLLQVSRYIHLNPAPEYKNGQELFSQPSSYPVYLGQSKQPWVKPDFILSFFDQAGNNTYQDFVGAAMDDSSIPEKEWQSLMID